MPWLKFKRHLYATPLGPAVSVCQSGRTYLCSGTAEGVVAVPFKADAEELLHPAGDRSSEWEVAWERYGVTFDAQGKEVNGSPSLEPPVVPVPPELVPASVAQLEPAKRRGRPPKRR